MSAAATSTGPGMRADDPAGAFTSILSAAVGGAAAKLEQQVVGWTDNSTASHPETVAPDSWWTLRTPG